MSIEEIFEKYYSSIDEIEIVIFNLKEIGLSQMQSTKALMEKLNISLKKADELVVNSKTWAENRNAIMDFRNDFFDFLDDKYNKSDSTDGNVVN